MTRVSLLSLFSSVALAALCGLGSLAACGGSTGSSPNDADAATGGGGGGGGGAGGGEGGTSDGSSGSDGAADSGKVITHAPAVHRATAAACSHDRGPGDFDTQLMNAQCQADADCTMGTNGRCLRTKVAARNNYCSYDTCFADADCGGAKVCTCREFPNDDNRCQAGNCKLDADCGAGGYCSPSADPGATNFGTTGWWCHTAKDECADDTDCNSMKREKCVYDPMITHWSCSSQAFLPP